jgi:hypothetical protein
MKDASVIEKAQNVLDDTGGHYAALIAIMTVMPSCRLPVERLKCQEVFTRILMTSTICETPVDPSELVCLPELVKNVFAKGDGEFDFDSLRLSFHQFEVWSAGWGVGSKWFSNNGQPFTKRAAQNYIRSGEGHVIHARDCITNEPLNINEFERTGTVLIKTVGNILAEKFAEQRTDENVKVKDLIHKISSSGDFSEIGSLMVADETTAWICAPLILFANTLFDVIYENCLGQVMVKLSTQRSDSCDPPDLTYIETIGLPLPHCNIFQRSELVDGSRMLYLFDKNNTYPSKNIPPKMSYATQTGLKDYLEPISDNPHQYEARVIFPIRLDLCGSFTNSTLIRVDGCASYYDYWIQTGYRPSKEPALRLKPHISAFPSAAHKMLMTLQGALPKSFKLSQTLPAMRELYLMSLFQNVGQGISQYGKWMTIYPLKNEECVSFGKKADDILSEAILKGVLRPEYFIPLIGDASMGKSGGVFVRDEKAGRNAPGKGEPWPDYGCQFFFKGKEYTEHFSPEEVNAIVAQQPEFVNESRDPDKFRAYAERHGLMSGRPCNELENPIQRAWRIELEQMRGAGSHI